MLKSSFSSTYGPNTYIMGNYTTDYLNEIVDFNVILKTGEEYISESVGVSNEEQQDLPEIKTDEDGFISDWQLGL